MTLSGRRIRLLWGLALAFALLAAANPLHAFTELGTRQRSASFCINSAPNDVGTARARTLLQEAIGNWHVAAGQDASPGLTLAYHATCSSSTTVWVSAYSNATLVSIGLPSGVAAVALPADPSLSIDNWRTVEIAFNDSLPWWDGNGSRGTNELSYEGVLTHEMGHAIGIGHAGNAQWTYDGSAWPSMHDCGNGAADSVGIVSLEQDDWGAAAYVRGGARYYFNSNPGFEAGINHWGKSGTVWFGSSYAITGSQGARIRYNGNYLYITTVYDPQLGSGGGRHPDMDTTPTINGFTFYKTPFTAGGVDVRLRYRLLSFNHTGCKTMSSPSVGSWFSYVQVASCAKSTSWKSCRGSQNYTLDNAGSVRQALVVRVAVRNTANNSAYVDKAGVYGGTSP